MTDPRTCSRCGAPLPEGGECARCLLRLGLELPPRDPTGPAPSEPAAAPAARRPVPLPLEDVARRFPQLEVKALVGQGGMAVVYRARQPRLGRDVALKLLPPEQSRDPAFAERFLREARAMARLAHPNIVAVHDFGESDGLCWLVMDFVDGVNLRQAMTAGALPPEKALAIVPQMCDALQYAHDEGVVHRDIKPENVLVDRQGRVKIADFGLAKLMGPQDITLTGDQQVFGTPHYMAPEQMEAARDVDHRADIFSLGVVFYEMLTGKLPLGRFEPPSRRVKVDVRLDEIVLHALEHEPERRYQHAAEVRTDVASVVAGHAPEAARAARPGSGDQEPLEDDILEAAGLKGDEPQRKPLRAFAGVWADAGVEGRPPAVKPKHFAGLWLEWPRARNRPRVAAAARTASGAEAAAPARVRTWNLQAAWVLASMVIWITAAWRFAGEMATHGPAGIAAGVALLVVTAWVYVCIGVHAVPRLRDALAAESQGARALRGLLALPLLIAGVLFIGHGVVEDWERGTQHYLTDSRSSRWVNDPGPWLPDLSFRPQAAEPPVEEGFTPAEAWQLGTLLAAAAVAALVLRRGAGGAGVATIVGVPLLLIGGVQLTALWSDGLHEAEAWPERVTVSGRVDVDLGLGDPLDAVQVALERDGYALDRVVRSLEDGKVTMSYAGFEPRLAWDRWDLEDGMPRRRRPYVMLVVHRRGADDVDSRVDWSCGRVCPVAGEPEAWREWLERILRESPRFTPTASGG